GLTLIGVRTRKAVEGVNSSGGTFAQYLKGVQLSVNPSSKLSLKAIYASAYDDQDSISNYASYLKPKKSEVLSLLSEAKLGKSSTINLESAFGRYDSDKTDDNIKEVKDNAYQIEFSSKLGKLNYSLGYRFIGKDFVSLANPYLVSDRKGVELKADSPLKKGITLKTTLSRFKDNVEGDIVPTTTTDYNSLALNLLPPKFPLLNLSYSRTAQKSNELIPSVDNSSDSKALGLLPSFGKTDVSLNYQNTKFEDKTGISSNTKTDYYNLGIRREVSSSIFILGNYGETKLKDLRVNQETKSENLTLESELRFLKNKAGSFITRYYGADNSGSQVQNEEKTLSFRFNYNLSPIETRTFYKTLSLEYRMSRYTDEIDNLNDYKENKFLALFSTNFSGLALKQLKFWDLRKPGPQKVSIKERLPRIYLTSPVDGQYVNTETIDVNGTAFDEGKIVKVLVQDREIKRPPEKSYAFAQVITLNEGENVIRVSAENSAGKSYTESLKVTLDTRGPDIKILYPAEEKVKESKIDLQGSVSDMSQISRITVNDIPLEITPSKEVNFSKEISLSFRENKIFVEAEDILGNKNREIVKVFREEEVVEAPVPEVEIPEMEEVRRGVPGKPIVIIDGKELKTDVAPMIINRRTMIPLEETIFDPSEVKYKVLKEKDGLKAIISGEADGKEFKIVLFTGTTRAVINNKEEYLDVKPFSIGKYMMVPLRRIYEEIGYKVNWDSEKHLVVAEK
ncbi:MAG: hypothetical protein COS84_08730, partial [Armatimonadetes bacterium CG07_land_8_20_14_0_80_40_9]